MCTHCLLSRWCKWEYCWWILLTHCLYLYSLIISVMLFHITLGMDRNAITHVEQAEDAWKLIVTWSFNDYIWQEYMVTLEKQSCQQAYVPPFVTPTSLQWIGHSKCSSAHYHLLASMSMDQSHAWMSDFVIKSTLVLVVSDFQQICLRMSALLVGLHRSGV